MRKLHKDYYLHELFTNSLQGKSWLEVGSDTPESSAKLSRLNKCRDFKVASRTPRAPHVVRFSKEDLLAWPDKSFDYVLFNWSIGMFSTEAILKQAARIAREGIIIQDFLLGELSPKVPGYQFYTDLQWREILNSFGQIHVEMQIPEQALELPMRKPPQVRLFVVQVADNRDTLPAAPNQSWQFAELPPILEVLEHPATQELLAKVGPILQNSPGIEAIHTEPLFPKLTFRPPVDADDFAMNIMASSDAPACVSFPEKLVAPFPRSLEQLDEAAGPSMTKRYNGQDMVGDDTPLCPRCGRDLAPDDLPEETIQAIKEGATPPLCINCGQGQFSTPEEPDYTNAEYAAFLDSSSGTKSES